MPDGWTDAEPGGRDGPHRMAADEPEVTAATTPGRRPQELLAASLACCTAITIEMYAERKGWEVGDVAVDVDYEPAQRGSPTRFDMVVQLPKELPEEQRERLMQIVAKCPVHRVLRARSCSRRGSSWSDQEPVPQLPHRDRSERPVAEPLVDRPAELGRHERGALAAALRGVGERVAEQQAGEPRPRASGTTATISTSLLPVVVGRDQARDGSPPSRRRRRGSRLGDELISALKESVRCRRPGRSAGRPPRGRRRRSSRRGLRPVGARRPSRSCAIAMGSAS